MHHDGMEHLVIYAIPAFLALVALEAAWLIRRGKAYDGRDAFASLAMGVGNVFVSAACKLGWLLVFAALYRHRLWDVDMSRPWMWGVLLLAHDFLFYCYHRFSHRVRLGWAAHVNHHSSRSFNLTTALRQSWTTPLYSYGFFMPLAVIGFPPVAVLTASAISLLYQFWIHTETIGRLGPLEWVMNTPSHHRVHHGANPQYIDRNYGGIFIIWDRLCGTFEPEREPVRYGLTHDIDSYNPLHIAFHDWAALFREMRDAANPGEALRRPFLPPGYRSRAPDATLATDAKSA
jgi:sterol desaturase/sphingolipid hydroxylase (fatty acid hydroxylase superfamily)